MSSDAYRYVTKENLLDLLESHGRHMLSLTHPDAHPYSDPRRAAPYESRYRETQLAWSRVNAGVDPVEVLRWLKHYTHSIEHNHIRLMISALLGEFERSTPPTQGKGFEWFTHGGDFYSVYYGDSLNRPRVERVANKYLPSERRETSGAQAIANGLANPCTRIKTTVQVG